MNNVLNSISANGTAMSNFKNVAKATILCSLFGLLTMSFQTVESNLVKSNSAALLTCPTADFAKTNNGCEGPCEITFINLSVNATSYLWDFGDGDSSTDTNPQHVYQDAGTYQVKLTAITGECQSSFIGVVEVVNN